MRGTISRPAAVADEQAADAQDVEPAVADEHVANEAAADAQDVEPDVVADEPAADETRLMKPPNTLCSTRSKETKFAVGPEAVADAHVANEHAAVADEQAADVQTCPVADEHEVVADEQAAGVQIVRPTSRQPVPEISKLQRPTNK